jgi:glucose/arabinose dehydrogenase
VSPDSGFSNISASNISNYKLVHAFPNLSFKCITEMLHHGNKLYVVQDTGVVHVFDNNQGATTKKTFLNMVGLVSVEGQTGLMGIAFHPNYASNRHFYVHCIKVDTLYIYRFTTSTTNPDSASVNSRLLLIKEPVLYPGHYGGKIAFGPDGFLYISTGDSGNGTDTSGTASRRLNTIWGKLLRIDVNSTTSGRNYAIPFSNPYYNNLNGYREEIYAVGFRNLWKFSIESDGNIWGADVGEHYREEINLIRNGGDYGWNKMEGELCFPDSTSCDTSGLNLSRPIFTYPHFTGPVNSNGSITGGYLYKGSELPGLYNKYIHGDFVKGKVWALSYDGVNKTTSDLLLDTTFYISTFGKDAAGNIYACNYNPGRIYKLSNTPSTDTVHRIAAPLKYSTKYFWRVRSVGGQWSHPNSFTTLADTTSPFEPESKAMFLRMPTITNSEKILMDSVVKGFKSYGLWSKFHLVYCFATLDTGIASTNWISQNYRAVRSGILNFSANEGFTSDGTTGRMSTQWCPSYVSSFLNSGSVGVYSRTNVDEIGRVLSCRSAENDRLLLILRSSNSTMSRMNINPFSLPSDTNTDSRGLFVINRSGAANVESYQNGIQTGANSTYSGSLSTQPLTIFCNNDNGTFGSYSTSQLSWVIAGSSFSSVEQANINRVIDHFMRRKGKQVSRGLPLISFASLNDTNSFANRNLMNVIISDSDGIEIANGKKPRVYYKRTTDENTFADNTNTSSGWKFSESNNNSSPFNFTLNYSLLHGGGINNGDTIQYFTVAQDRSPVPLVGVNSGILNSEPESVNLNSASFPVTGFMNSYTVIDPGSVFTINVKFRLGAVQLSRKDTVTINLRSSTSPYNLVESRYVVTDTVSGDNSTYFFNAQSQFPYYLEIIHRNSITSWSNPFQFQGNSASYDFTTSVCMTYGCNSQLVNGKASFFSGDVDRNQNIDLDDVVEVYNDANAFRTGYIITDLNADNVVNLNDLLVCHNNSTTFRSEVSP